MSPCGSSSPRNHLWAAPHRGHPPSGLSSTTIDQGPSVMSTPACRSSGLMAGVGPLSWARDTSRNEAGLCTCRARPADGPVGRTGAPKSSATGWDRAPVHDGWTPSRRVGERNGHEWARTLVSNRRSASHRSRYQPELEQADQSSSPPTGGLSWPWRAAGGRRTSADGQASASDVGVCTNTETTAAPPCCRRSGAAVDVRAIMGRTARAAPS
jgi:hypothetical protein